MVKEFWEKQAEAAGGEASLKNMVPYITSKFDTFISNDYMRPIIGQVKSTFKFREILDQKKIFLVNLSKGRLGEINSSLLGLIITGKITIAAFSRVDVPESERRDFHLYIDEFQNFATDTISTILSDALKTGANCLAKNSESSAPTRKDEIVPTLPKTLSRIFSSSWPMN